jgi:hypothetical protein
MGSVESAVEQLRRFTVSAPFARVLELEQSATRILQIQPTHVPGVLQAPEYAAAALSRLSGKPADDPDVRERVELRVARGEAFLRRLDSATPPTLAVALDESVLTSSALDAGVIRAQIAHLSKILARYPSVHLALPSLSAAGYTEARACEVFEHDGAIEATFFEELSVDDITTDPEAGRGYRDLVTTLLATGEVDGEALAKLSD